jgi:hypothetical protein
LDLIEKELNNNQNHTVGALKNLIIELSSKDVSILQIASDDTGVITLNNEDCLWIEQLSQASLLNDEQQYFLTSDSRLTFDFNYVQSQIIRTYLLLCRINYRHIIQKYQCHTKRIQTTTATNVDNLELDEKYLIPLSEAQLENEWIYLKDMLLDKLYHAHSLLRQIALALKNHPDDKSSIYLFEFVRMTDRDNDLYQKLEQYEIKDFQLCYIDHVLKLYTESMSGFQYLFTDIPPLLRVPIDSQLNNELIQKFTEYLRTVVHNNDIEKIQFEIELITKFLNELKKIEDTLLQQSTQSLTETCKYVAIENPILSYIPERIKCENYVALSISLIRTRSNFQELKVKIEEKEMKLWDENFNSYEQQDKQTNRFHQYLNPQDEEQTFYRRQYSNESNNWILPTIDTEGSSTEYEQQMKSDDLLDEYIEYISLMELNIKSVPCTSSILIQQVHKYREESQVESITTTKAQIFTIVHPDGKSIKYFWKSINFCEQLKKLFLDKKYDHDVFVVVDKNEIFVDFTKKDYCPSLQSVLEYRIIEKQLLIQTQFRFRSQISEYLTTSKANFPAIIYRFIDDNHLKSLSLDNILCFFDEYGKCINDGNITDACKIITILVTEETSNTNNLCEIALRYKSNEKKNS